MLDLLPPLLIGEVESCFKPNDEIAGQLSFYLAIYAKNNNRN